MNQNFLRATDGSLLSALPLDCFFSFCLVLVLSVEASLLGLIAGFELFFRSGKLIGLVEEGFGTTIVPTFGSIETVFVVLVRGGLEVLEVECLTGPELSDTAESFLFELPDEFLPKNLGSLRQSKMVSAVGRRAGSSTKIVPRNFATSSACSILRLL